MKFVGLLALAGVLSGCATVSNVAGDVEIPVLIYHKISTSTPSQTNITAERFKQHLQKINDMGYRTITMSELEDHVNRKISLPEKSVAINFDDGYKSDLQTAAPLLNSFGMKATFYVMSGAWQSQTYMSKDELKQLSANQKFQIGAHTHTHFMEWEGRMEMADERVIFGEIVMSKLLIEDVIGKPVTSFSWPFGYYRESILNMLPRMGFTSSVHVNAHSANSPKKSTMWISRINIDGNCSPDQLEKMIVSRKFVKCD